MLGVLVMLIFSCCLRYRLTKIKVLLDAKIYTPSDFTAMAY